MLSMESGANRESGAKETRKWQGIAAGIVALLLLTGGVYLYRQHAFKAAIRPYALKDNVLITDMLDLKDSSKTTIAEYLEKAKKNMESREQIIQDVRMVDPGPYQTELNSYVELLNLENEFLKSEQDWQNAYVKAQVQKEDKKRREEECAEMNYYSARLVCRDKDRRQWQANMDEAVSKWLERDNENMEIIQKWSAKETDCQKGLSGLIPSRKLIAIKLEKIAKELQERQKSGAK